MKTLKQTALAALIISCSALPFTAMAQNSVPEQAQTNEKSAVSTPSKDKKVIKKAKHKKVSKVKKEAASGEKTIQQ